MSLDEILYPSIEPFNHGMLEVRGGDVCAAESAPPHTTHTTHWHRSPTSHLLRPISLHRTHARPAPKVSDIHTIYFEECGNPSGFPVVFLCVWVARHRRGHVASPHTTS